MVCTASYMYPSYSNTILKIEQCKGITLTDKQRRQKTGMSVGSGRDMVVLDSPFQSWPPVSEIMESFECGAKSDDVARNP